MSEYNTQIKLVYWKSAFGKHEYKINPELHEDFEENIDRWDTIPTREWKNIYSIRIKSDYLPAEFKDITSAYLHFKEYDFDDKIGIYVFRVSKLKY